MGRNTILLSWLVAGVILLIILAAMSVMWGSTKIPLATVTDSLAAWISGQHQEAAGPLYRIIVDLRLPRVFLAIFVGGGLGLTGVLLQTTTHNDLADPFLFGLSSGASAGAVLVISVHGDTLGVWTLPLASFAGGMIASVLVILLVRRMARSGPEKIILAGLAISFVFTALTNYLIFSGDQRAAHSILFWSLGGLGLSRWQNLPIAGFAFVVLFCYALINHRKFDALLAGEATAKTLGVNPRRLQYSAFLVAAFSTAVFVSLSGIIGFIGLMVPHIARIIHGPLHKGLVLLSALLGGMVLLGSDLIARIILAPQELPVGIITTSAGGLFVFFLLMRQRR
ncbi:MAG: ABC transporter permease [Desulfobulbus propionicus]|nr:MAG: ABC transporter permease [Desulfobulbus propionicus]